MRYDHDDVDCCDDDDNHDHDVDDLDDIVEYCEEEEDELLQLLDDSLSMRSAASAIVAETLLPATLFFNMNRTCAVFARMPSRTL